jgi:RNA polymerase sigma factor (sigma-70 family)
VGTLGDGDTRLVARCRAGDQMAWRGLVERHAGLVNGILRGAFRLSASDADDAFQEVFSRLYVKLDQVRNERALGGWIAQVTRNVALDTLRRNGRVQLVGEDIETADVDDAIAEVFEALWVREALAGLPDHQREIIERFFVRDESYQTIGAALGIPAGTIASRISRALAALRAEIQIEGRTPVPAASP